MARSLFAVYRDDMAVAGPSNAFNPASATLTNKPSSRRQDDAQPLTATRRGLGTREKENDSPFGAPALGKAAFKKGDGPLKVAKSGEGSSRAPVRRGLGASAKVGLQIARPSTNGICTGSLRTRVLPDLPPLPVDSAATGPSVSIVGGDHDSASEVLPVVEITTGETHSAESSPRGSCDRSYASTTDSGYAQSPRPRTRTRPAAPTESLVGDVDGAESDMSLVGEERPIDVADANRRARALTESPLAEVRSSPCQRQSRATTDCLYTGHPSLHWPWRVLRRQHVPLTRRAAGLRSLESCPSSSVPPFPPTPSFFSDAQDRFELSSSRSADCTTASDGNDEEGQAGSDRRFRPESRAETDDASVTDGDATLPVLCIRRLSCACSYCTFAFLGPYLLVLQQHSFSYSSFCNAMQQFYRKRSLDVSDSCCAPQSPLEGMRERRLRCGIQLGATATRRATAVQIHETDGSGRRKEKGGTGKDGILKHTFRAKGERGAKHGRKGGTRCRVTTRFGDTNMRCRGMWRAKDLGGENPLL